jgi:hypothetical protein
MPAPVGRVTPGPVLRPTNGADSREQRMRSPSRVMIGRPTVGRKRIVTDLVGAA